MATETTSHTVRSVTCRIRHFLFPSRREMIVGAVINAIAVLLGAPVVAHILLELAVHVVFAVTTRRQKHSA